MVRLKKISVILIFIFLSSFCLSSTLETKDGYYIDSRGEFRDSYIKPPHPENIPSMSRAVQPVVDFESYYKVNSEGYRGKEDKLPVSPAGYTQVYSTRKFQPYSKETYVNVWCSGEKNVGKVDCLTKDYAISYFPISSWSRGITTAAWRARNYPQQGMAVFYAEDTAAHSNDMYEAKKWAEKWGTKVMFISIDTGIPAEWIN